MKNVTKLFKNEAAKIGVEKFSVKRELFAIFDAAHAAGEDIFTAALGHHYSRKCISSYATYWRRERSVSSARIERHAA